MGNKVTIFREWMQIVAGLAVFSLGIHLTIYANIGLAPWDCLGMGVAAHTPFNYGIVMTLMGVLILAVDLLLKERIGFGTILDALLSGNLIQFFNDRNPLPENHDLLTGILCILLGFVFVALGMRLYMGAGQGCGPRDTLLVGLGKRLPKVPIGFVEILLWSAVLLTGWLLGGPVGPGTVISTFGAGLILQAVYSVIRFEPRDVRQKDVVEVIKML